MSIGFNGNKGARPLSMKDKNSLAEMLAEKPDCESSSQPT